MRILFISSNRLGDAILTCGILDHLIRTHPTARFTVATGPAAAEAFMRTPQLEQLIVLDKQGGDRHWLRLWRQVAFIWWDLVVDVRGSALGWLIPARRRVIRRRDTGGRMFEQHVAMLGVDPAPLPVAWTAEADQARATSLLPPGKLAIALGVTANWAPKIWAPERFAALFERLAASLLPGAVPVVFAGPGSAEREAAAPALALLPGAIDLRGTVTIPEAAAVIGRCALYVGNDSGLMHLAAATGTPTVGLFGATLDRAAAYTPAGLRSAWAAADTPSMDALTVERALAACATVLG